MEILLRRIAFKEDYTIGRLYVNHKLLCDSLEPLSAHFSNRDNEELIIKRKHDGIIAIPTGTYKVQMSISSKFHRLMPYIIGVKGFDGIMIHPGNYPKDTLGCILPGWNRRKGMVCGSRSAFAEILDYISVACRHNETVRLTVKER